MGPLNGIRIVEFAGIGPGPFCGMMLADHGGEVIRIERPGFSPNTFDPTLRNRRTVTLDLKSDTDVAAVRSLVATADGLIEGFRPGVMEGLGLGPDVLLADNPNLVYGRMTGWGQAGPLSKKAGHDINYIAVSGVLGACGRPDGKPTPPINLLGDFGGGGLMLAFGMVSALLAVRNGAPGQVVDAAMTDGSALLMSLIWGYRSAGRWNEVRGTNILDTGAPFYDTYETADGLYVAVGAIEPQFYAAMLDVLGLSADPLFNDQFDQSLWPGQKHRIAAQFHTRSRKAWIDAFATADACFSPVLSMSEALADDHNKARQTFVEIDKVWQPAPAPRYSVTRCDFIPAGT